ncbi:shikimate dehydrogenase [Nevskia ramosa]|uniref:shikimate dehydrogenase n=1 Tax=Nevskia ramosa TaxID=64002 RepID=UPI0003B571CB|nr:shikimate dehydrogenase [Nevskia ramosa]
MSNVDREVSRYGVLGQPVAHSKSPRIHAAFAKSLGQKLLYEAYEIAPDELGPSLTRFHGEGWQGFNLTLPHKTAAASLCESRTDAAEQAGAVNTLIRTATGWQGDNTDGAGLVRDLVANLGVVVKGKRVLVLGAGGAARGILAPLLAEAPSILAISNRNPWKPEEIAAAMKPLGNIVPRTHLSLKGDQFDVLLNATSAGHQGSVPRLPPGLFAPGAIAYDLNYGPASEPFLAWAKAEGASKLSDGLGMLVEQAAEAFQRWRGTRPETTAVLAGLRAG